MRCALMRFAPYLVWLCAGSALLACSSSTVTTDAIVRPELLSVSPNDFLGAVPCRPDFTTGTTPGAGGEGGDNGDAGATVATPTAPVAKSYVATVRDVTLLDPKNPAAGTVDFNLMSSPPTPCSQPVTFSFIVAYHTYDAHVDAYTENASELTPFALGSPSLVDGAGNRVEPRWSADCTSYPPSPAAGGSGGADSGGAAGAVNDPGVPVYDGYTQTPHNCGSGLK